MLVGDRGQHSLWDQPEKNQEKLKSKKPLNSVKKTLDKLNSAGEETQVEVKMGTGVILEQTILEVQMITPLYLFLNYSKKTGHFVLIINNGAFPQKSIKL